MSRRASSRHAAMPDAQLTESELIAWGERFGAECQAPMTATVGGVERARPLIVAIEGDLGAGKTTLARAICRGFGVTEDVTSPTFALVHRYESGRAPVYHLDLYRLAGPGDLTNLGWDDIMNEPALVLVEWPERAGDRLPAAALRVRLSHLSASPAMRALHVESR
ncbi:MAG TPA: tRNA (adenosine(37)-N6)-threonylcarbamoyltransferase complex ATPase subunit type 1 TsaE [Gemmatimonadaceae bacterium]|nr:tRNA (adenosine(37)-N6)-threonylcarbamoyltransferase complex ATPase subunit type 1 TsaE [Gemmatimonadaceae bacterium]